MADYDWRPEPTAREIEEKRLKAEKRKAYLDELANQGYTKLDFKEAVGCLVCGTLVATDLRDVHRIRCRKAGATPRCPKCQGILFEDQGHECHV